MSLDCTTSLAIDSYQPFNISLSSERGIGGFSVLICRAYDVDPSTSLLIEVNSSTSFCFALTTGLKHASISYTVQQDPSIKSSDRLSWLNPQHIDPEASPAHIPLRFHLCHDIYYRISSFSNKRRVSAMALYHVQHDTFPQYDT